MGLEEASSARIAAARPFAAAEAISCGDAALGLELGLG